MVERGVAPESISARKLVNDAEPAQGVEFNRPLCPYPQQARYDGTGDPNAAESFSCTAAQAQPAVSLPSPAFLR
jgi:feruloyl esterase